MSINKLQAALASATNEFTLAAANLNFDFSIIKIEAPKEYQALGNSLSQYKRETAETGKAHVTARRLGALFDGVCPPTPKLLRAYGMRVSEIADTASKIEKIDQGIFAQYSGVDGTSIWASATSSVAALQLQLLACMLAKVWKSAQATSIWYELVKERRAELVSRYEYGEEMHVKLMTAAVQSEISRESLGEWDASARAWLQVADRVKSREQTKLRLILDNIDTNVSDDKNVFASVMQAWKAAAASMENLLSGMPQGTDSGPALLALSSWHIYPDILIANQGLKEALFGDPLMPSAAKLTIGLTRPPTQTGNRGIHWSLSLQHLQAYGRPVQADARLEKDASKLTFEEFTQAVLGCILGRWGCQGSELDAACRILVQLQSTVENASQDDEENWTAPRAVDIFASFGWSMMARAAAAYCDLDQDAPRKLVRLGMRRWTQFLPFEDDRDYNDDGSDDRDDHSVEKLFGLLNINILIRCLKDPDARIALLRRLVVGTSTHDCTLKSQPILIRYHESASHNFSIGHLATAMPATTAKQQRDESESGTEDIQYSHVRWIHPQDTHPVHDEKIEYMLEKTDFTLRGALLHDLENDHVYRLCYGIPNLASIYQRLDVPIVTIRDLSIDDIVWVLQEGLLNPSSLMNTFSRTSDSPNQNSLMSTMQMFRDASIIYEAFDSASVCVDVLRKPLQYAKWIKHLQLPRPTLRTVLTREFAFSCVAYFGCSADIDPELLENVFAIAYEDSIFLASQLTCDPLEEARSWHLQRILGNVGRAGITILVPPQSTIVRPVDGSFWQVASDTLFDGLALDCFSKTSLHLSFTDYCVPLYQRDERSTDHAIHVLEAVVSVYDSEAWVGDIDILKALWNHVFPQRISIPCRHQHQEVANGSIISAECWDDILDPPAEQFVVRSHGNWVGRLAAVAMLSQTLPQPKKCPILICPDSTCWTCFSEACGEEQLDGARAFIF